MLDDPEGTVTRLWPDWLTSRERSKEWQAWALGRQALPVVPDTATDEYHELQKKAVTPWLGLVVSAFVQSLIVDGYRSRGSAEDAVMWAVWQANRMDAKQAAVFEAAVTTGASYVAVLPTGAPRPRSSPKVDGVAVPEWRPYSSAEMTAFFESPHDDWPVLAIAAEPSPDWRGKLGDLQTWRASLIDDTHVHLIEVRNGVAVAIEEPRPHGFTTPPVVQFASRRTITGRAIGEVEPYVAVASRIDQDVFDRLVVQRYASWRVRYATGLVEPEDEDEKRLQERELLISDLLVSSSTETQFGSLPATEMTGHLRAPMEDVRHLSAVAQVPPTILTADLTNISAEALAAVDAAYNRKVEHMKESFGESIEMCFDLSAKAMGQEPDPSAQVRWRDMESRSLAQTADALVKLQGLGIPDPVLWDKVGILTDQDRQTAMDLRARESGMGMLLDSLARGQQPEPEPV